MKTQWYKIVRDDGTIQYATKSLLNGKYYISNSSFGRRHIDGHISKIKGKPPIEYKKGRCSLGLGTFTEFTCYHDLNDIHKGRFTPFLLNTEVTSFMRTFQSEETTFILKGEILFFSSKDTVDIIMIPPSKINNELVYDLSKLNWEWQFTY